MQRPGLPKTDKERLITHISRYGNAELPARGAGLAQKPVMANMAKVYTPSKVIIISATTAAFTTMGSYALTQALRKEEVGFGKLLIVAIGSACIAGLTSFLVTRFFGD